MRKTDRSHCDSGGAQYLRRPGSAVAEVLAEHCPVPMERMGAVDFAESGDYEQLMEKYGYGPESIAQRCRDVMKRKQDSRTRRLLERTRHLF